MSEPRTHRSRPDLLLNSGFVLTGMVTTLLGPMLPVYKLRWSLTDTQAGYFFVAQFLATTLVTVASTAIIARTGSRRTLTAGYATMALGIAILVFPQFVTALLGTVIYGLGLGLAVPATNLFVAARQRETGNAAALNVVNFFWGMGAVTLPAVISATGPQLIPHLLSALAALLFLAAMGMGKFFPKPVRNPPPESPAPAGARSHLRAAAALGTAFFLYVGAENAVGGWIASYARQYMPAGSRWALTTALFWAGLLTIRAAAPILLRVLREKTLAHSGIVVAGLGIALVLSVPSVVGISAGAFITGLGMGPIFPSMVILVADLLGKNVARHGGAIFAAGGLGGAALPLLVGEVSTHFGALHFGMWVPLGALGGLFFLYWGFREGSGGRTI